MNMNNQYVEKEVTIKGAYDLAATLAIPNAENPRTAIVIVGGTGDNDRNGNAPNGKFNMLLYKELSDFFVRLGFITLRYDKRGVAKSKGVQIETGFYDLVDDVIANAKYLEIRCVTPAR